jgi:tRNA-specific 2-thiouridylase
MQSWSEEEEGYCSGRNDLENVHRVCKYLNIPYDVVRTNALHDVYLPQKKRTYTCFVVKVNFEREYWNYVFEPTLNDYARGYTPNPDVLCNREIKFNRFIDYALQRFNVDYIATGTLRLRMNERLSTFKSSDCVVFFCLKDTMHVFVKVHRHLE